MRVQEFENGSVNKIDLIIKYVFRFMTVIMAFSVLVLTVTIPGVYGILIQSNDYPEVTLDIKKTKVKTDGKEIIQPVLEILKIRIQSNQPNYGCYGKAIPILCFTRFTMKKAVKIPFQG